jgi:hypothetical protein
MTAFLNRTAEKTGSEHIDGLQNSISVAYDMLHLHRNSAASKDASLAAMENEATLVRLAYGGTYSYKLTAEANWNDISGCGHHGPDYVGAASVRSGKGVRYAGGGAPRPIHIV